MVTWFFWLHMIIYDYFSSVFCIVPKKVLLLKYRKWDSHLKNRYHYAKIVENTRINFSISPYCIKLFSRKESFNFFAALWMCEDISIEILPIPHWTFSKTANKSTQTRCKVCLNLTKCTTTIDFSLIVSFLLTLNTSDTLL